MNKEHATFRHVHPFTILENLGRVLFLSIIPILRGFFYALQGDLGQWVQSAWIDILIFLIMISIAVWRWWKSTYCLDESGITLQSGWLFTRCMRIPWRNIRTISMIESFYLRPFHAARLRADTIGGTIKKSDFAILLSHKHASDLMQYANPGDQQQADIPYRPKTSAIIALALLTSNSFAGIVFISTFVSQSGRLLGKNFSSQLVDTFQETVRVLAFGLPPAAAATAYILLAGWFIAFLMTLLRYHNFTVSRSRHTLCIQGGVLSKRQYCIRYPSIAFIDIRQSITTRVLKLYSLYIYAVGYAKQQDDIRCIIPTENRATFYLHFERLFPAFSPSPRLLAPKKNSFLRYTGGPLFLLIALLTAAFLLINHVPAWRSFILFVGGMCMIAVVFALLIEVMDVWTGGVGKSGAHYTLRYSKGFYLHTVVIPESCISTIELRQSWLQALSGNCDLFVTTHAEGRIVHHCRNLDRLKLTDLLAKS